MNSCLFARLVVDLLLNEHAFSNLSSGLAGFWIDNDKFEVSSGGSSVSKQTETDLMFRPVGLKASCKNIGVFVRDLRNHCTLPISRLPLVGLSGGAARRHEIGKSWVVLTLVPA